MLIKYIWSAKQEEVASVTVEADRHTIIPRIGETVEIELVTDQGMRANKSGKVRDVKWRLTNLGNNPTIVLGR